MCSTLINELGLPSGEERFDCNGCLIPMKFALIIGISDYAWVNDLNYCDDDAVRWKLTLEANGYTVILLSDHKFNHQNVTPNGLATKYNICFVLNYLGHYCQKGDKFTFIASGHGVGDRNGNSYICCYYFNKSIFSFTADSAYGLLTDNEFAGYLVPFRVKQVPVIAFFDVCYSGGMLNEIVNVNPSLNCAISTCTEGGQGYDNSTYKYGKWTYAFLVKCIIRKGMFDKPLKEIFDCAKENYQINNVLDTPLIVGNGDLTFC